MPDIDKIREAFDACERVFPPAIRTTAEFRVLKFQITGVAEVDLPKKEFPDLTLGAEKAR